MGLSSAGIGSGLPIENIITQLMSFEQRPLTLLDQKVAGFQAKLSAMGTLKSAFDTFKTAAQGLADISKFQALSTTVGDAAVATATAGTSAAVGSYALEVSQLAQAQKLASSGQASAATQIGGGTISFDLGTISGGSFDSATGKYTNASFSSSGAAARTVTIDPSNSSLAGIRDAINKAGVGVTAAIVNDGSATPYRLVLTETATGKASSMKISVAGDTGTLGSLLNHDPAGAQAMTETVKAQNAEFKLDGLAISSATNNAADVIDGVTLNLAKTNVGSPTTVAVARDTKTVAESVGKFVSAYNAINKTLNDLSAYNPITKKGGALNGDSTVRSMQTQLRSLLGSPVANGGTGFTMLSDIGVTVKAGVMAVDDARLQKAIASNFNDIAGLFAATGKPSDSLLAFTGATANTQPGQYAVKITQPATQGSFSAGIAPAPEIDATNNKFDVTLNGVTATITLEPRVYATAAEFAAELESKINGAAPFSAAGSKVSITESGGNLSIASNRYGASSGVDIGGTGAVLFTSPTPIAGLNVAGEIGGVPATGSGRTLTAAAGSPAEGLALLVDGAAGNRGTVSYAKGYASQFEQLASTLLDTAKGPLASRTEGINASIKRLADNRVHMEDRLAATEKRLRAQYSSLDATISRMNSTSSYLAQQLTALSNMTI
ncbi:MAG: flagellar hook protein FliD [Massilia sp.]|nr:flagellar hook protein FliD [Massilia sp.]